MPYDESLAAGIRKTLPRRKNITEKRMFGRIGFMLGANPVTKTVRIFDRPLQLSFGPKGRNFWVDPNGKVGPAAP